MLRFDRPENLNGTELRNELKAAQIPVSDDMNFLLDDGQGNLFIGISASYKTQAAEIVAAHNGTTVAPEPTVADKLASVGLNLDDLKSALGL
jgi:hypothetical protein